MLDTILQPKEDGTVHVSLVSHLRLSQKVEKGLEVGNTTPVEVVANNNDYIGDDPVDDKSSAAFVMSTDDSEAKRRKAEFS